MICDYWGFAGCESRSKQPPQRLQHTGEICGCMTLWKSMYCQLYCSLCEGRVRFSWTGGFSNVELSLIQVLERSLEHPLIGIRMYVLWVRQSWIASCYTAVEALSQFTGQWQDSGRQYRYRTDLPRSFQCQRDCGFESVLICFLCTPEPFYRGDSAEISAESEAFLVHLQFDIDSEASLQGKLCRIFPRKVSCCEE